MIFGKPTSNPEKPDVRVLSAPFKPDDRCHGVLPIMARWGFLLSGNSRFRTCACELVLCEGMTSLPHPDFHRAKAKPRAPNAKLLALCDLQRHATGRGGQPRTLQARTSLVLIIFHVACSSNARAGQSCKAYARAFPNPPASIPPWPRFVRQRLRVASWQRAAHHGSSSESWM